MVGHKKRIFVRIFKKMTRNRKFLIVQGNCCKFIDVVRINYVFCACKWEIPVKVSNIPTSGRKLLAVVILAVLCYVVAFAGFFFVFVVCYACLFYLLVFTLLTDVPWWVLRNKIHRAFVSRKLLFDFVVVCSGLFFFFGYKAVKRIALLHESPYLLRAAQGAVFVVTAVCCLNLLVKGWNKTTAASTFFYIATIFLLTGISFFVYPQNVTERFTTFDVLKTLPYLEWTLPDENINASSVTAHIPELSCKGVNIYGSITLPLFSLIDMEGEVLHKWFIDPKYGKVAAINELLNDGDLLTFSRTEDKFLRIGWDSKVKRTAEILIHHDFYYSKNGTVFLITRKENIKFFSGLPVPILEDYIAELSPEGQLKEISIFNAAKEYFSGESIFKIYCNLLSPKTLRKIFVNKFEGEALFWPESFFDIMHANSIEVIERDVGGVCGNGDILISIRELDLVAILDTDSEKFVWHWGPGILEKQHHPTMLENGNILLFDNGYYRKYSKVIELDPIEKKIVWEYTSDPKEEFFSRKRGSNQRLDNGNTLITESDRGRVFEVTKEGQIVWEFYNPVMLEGTSSREKIVRMARITDTENYRYLKDLDN